MTGFAAPLAIHLFLLAGSASAARMNGFNLPAWSEQGYDSAAGPLKELAATGAGWVALTPTWYQPVPDSSAPAPTKRTASDSSLRTAIRQAKALGLAVALKPHIDLEDGTRRALIRPADKKAWFGAYRDLSAHYAR